MLYEVITIDASELHKLRRAECPLVGDLLPTLDALLERLEPHSRPAWWDEIRTLQQVHPAPIRGEDIAHPQDLIHTVGRLLGPDAIVATDVGQHQMWTAQTYPFSRPRRITSYNVCYTKLLRQITYHGPGQLIAYLLLDVRRKGLGVRELVTALEQAVIRLLAAYGIAAVAKPSYNFV